MRHRLIIAAAVVFGAVCWSLAVPMLRAADGSGGLTLIHDTFAQTLVAMVAVAVCGLPVLLVGLFTSSVGNPLTGIFAVSGALTIVAWRGGGIDGWMRRMAEAHALPGAFRWLVTEVLVWQVGVVVMLLTIQVLRSPMRTRIPALAFDDHLGVDTKLHLPRLQSLAGGAVAAVAAGAISFIGLREADAGQVLMILLIAFTVGGLLGQSIFFHANPVGILFSPAIVACVGYGWVLMKYRTQDELLTAWHSLGSVPDTLPGLAMALPIHYASAAMVGCTIGVGLAQTIAAGAREASEALG